jgi:hypothetical protein
VKYLVLVDVNALWNQKKLVYAIANITHNKKESKKSAIYCYLICQINKELIVLSINITRSEISCMYAFCFDLIDVSKIVDPETLELVAILKLTSENLKNT